MLTPEDLEAIRNIVREEVGRTDGEIPLKRRLEIEAMCRDPRLFHEASRQDTAKRRAKCR